MTEADRLRENGWNVRERKVSDHVKELPTYQDWLLFLLDRCFAVITGWDALYERHIIEPTSDRNGRSAQRPIVKNGMVLFHCIGCGELFQSCWMSDITVGGMIKRHYLDITDSKGRMAEEGYRPMPVSRKGLGCKPCSDKFFEEMRRIETENKQRRALDLVYARLALLQGKTYKTRNDLKPYLDVLSNHGEDVEVGELEVTV